MKAIIVTLQTEQPVLATSFQGDPNSDVSYPYLPGSVIRGALIGRYLKCHSLQNADILQDESVQRLFFNGTTRFLNAYLDVTGKRTLPIPRSWRKEKGTDLPCQVFDLSQNIPEDTSLKIVDGEFCTVQSDSVTLYAVEKRINIHNLRHRRRGRAVPDKLDIAGKFVEAGEGAVFRYEAIDSGQTFQAIILCEDADEQTLKGLLNPADLWVGGSQSAGYGHTKIVKVASVANWDEVGIPAEERYDRETLVVTLLSDLILQDEQGHYVANPKLVAQQLVLPSQAKLKSSYTRTTLIGGFNRKWGLPLPQIQALAAGSVLVFENTSVTAEQIAGWEVQGLGDRRIEGFGRIAINWLGEHATFNAKSPESNSSRSSNIALTESSTQLAAQMAERLMRQKLDQLLLNQVGRASIDPTHITNSQLSRLILVARQALTLENREMESIQTLLTNLPANAIGQFERTRMNGSQKSLMQQLKDWIDNPKVWISNPPSVTIADTKVELSDRLAREYTLRLIMAVAKKATKEKQATAAKQEQST
ncbi:MAG: RAMP superfamily CRISPR-associated protein [Stenomitos frigidus ULC029]